MERSGRFRTLVADIERYEGIVYVEEGRCNGRARACLLVRLTRVPPFRILFVYVDFRGLDGNLIPLLGHELMHAVEVLRERNVDTDADVYHLFAKIGLWSSGRMAFETAAAVAASDDIHAELGRAPHAQPLAHEASASHTGRGARGHLPHRAHAEDGEQSRDVGAADELHQRDWR